MSIPVSVVIVEMVNVLKEARTKAKEYKKNADEAMELVTAASKAPCYTDEQKTRSQINAASARLKHIADGLIATRVDIARAMMECFGGYECCTVVVQYSKVTFEMFFYSGRD